MRAMSSGLPVHIGEVGITLLEELFERRPAVRVDVCSFGVGDRYRLYDLHVVPGCVEDPRFVR